MPIQYIGEHITPGVIGRIFIWFSFAASLAASLLYLLAFYRKNREDVFRKSARLLYLIHTAALVGVAIVLYYLIFNHYFEYSYVWQYSSKTLPAKYIISCFWAGQEGSFLVWAVWQALIGMILLFLAKKWESPVMAVFSFSQMFVTSMLLGVKAFGMQIGASPFLLLRETLDTLDGTIFSQPNYVSMIEDGNGLNPLLENIWMTIHPPILFIGYALALVPFSYAIASFMKKDYQTWIGRALPWTLLSLTFLGAGILLGGAWAYVSLTFGGFWAWDPVENSSLVPWMTLVAALHVMLIARKQHYALFASYLFVLISYVLVLYATYLTRSGVLSNTSAHSFGDSGMSNQLLIYLLTFMLLMVVAIARNARRFYVKKAELLLSREFWMFAGALVVAVAAFQIILTTSIPVFNAIFNTGVAPPSDPIGFYNRWQMPFSLLVAAFVAIVQFLNYGDNEPVRFMKKQIIPLLITILLMVPILVFGIVGAVNLLLFVFFILYAIIASLFNLFKNTTNSRNYPAIVTHLGFVVLLLGTVLTFSNSTVISNNTSQYDLGNQQANAENLLLMRNDTLYMGGFYVAYVNSRVEGNHTIYQVDFMKRTGERYQREFSLHPSVNVHPQMGAVYNPDTRNMIDKDYYTYIATVGRDQDYIVLKVIMNPYINILWLGCVVLVGGLSWAFWRRARHRWVSNT